MSRDSNRRDFLKAGAAFFIAATLDQSMPFIRGQGTKEKDVLEVTFYGGTEFGRWYFQPVGLYVKPGQTVRWTSEMRGGSVTAYHPANGNHELRIPEKAKPFDSGLLLDRHLPGAIFEYQFEHEGTYDYFSRNHERLGSVGRIVVGTPGGPGEKPLGYDESEGRPVIFPDVRKLFSWLTSDKIVREKKVSYPRDLMGLTYPLRESHF